ncbi:DEAD/DEAH box helicase [Roseburia inulinivorans]|uniref:Restriction endonuclease subunit R n=1 Tax=Roseburia inulinivorans TaxID=360807 RepID=A0A396AG82_9FIRM|nr:DEAD/DEAH box helicase family protein [Roseburia inulinivorans]RHD01011.1 restriction endonuclease subunit R [Roseburia inulinivorans]
MRDELISFQQTAVSKLLAEINSAQAYHRVDGRPQVIAFRAPTGSGKTIVMTEVIEDILNGTETTVEQPEAIFVWLSDSPQLNEQSKTKIIQKADKIRPNQCVTIEDDSFDQEMLDDGMIYFLNTQKLGKASRLVSGSDSRTYTIWQSLQNTAERKGNHLYVIIDEAHRGMQDREAARATSIMQKFLKGSEADGLDALPVVIGMSATDERFRRLVGNISSVRHDVDVRPDEVRASGLLKDRIIITYPEQDSIDDMVILQAAADEWKDKCEHWNYYCTTQKSQQVRPVLVIQVENRNSDSASATEIGECLSRIEARTGARFSEYEVVHTFGQTATIEAGGLKIHHVDASDIADNKKIRVVFFKENLSTGWDCPRAETMMSFRHAQDATYIAQLLGRMIRTPLQRHIDVDETLNEVCLFLPHFNKDNVESVMKALQDEEGSDIPADVEGESYGNDSRETWGYRPRKHQPKVDLNQMTLAGFAQSQSIFVDPLFEATESKADDTTKGGTTQEESVSSQQQKPDINIDNPSEMNVPAPRSINQGTTFAPQQSDVGVSSTPEPEQEQLVFTDSIDREVIATFINKTALITYEIKPFKTTDYLPSLIKLASLIKNTGLDSYALHSIQQDGVRMIKEYIGRLKENGEYDTLASEVKKLNLSWKVFDAFGKAVNEDKEYIYYTSSDEDIDRKFRIAEKILGGFGLGTAYGTLHFNPENPFEYMVHVILFAAEKDCVDKLHLYAKNKFNEMSDTYRLQFAHMQSEKYRKQYDAIISNGNEVSAHSFHLPEQIRPIVDLDGEKYYNHFFVNEEVGYAKIKLDSWEKAVIEEESKRDDFICWIRNPSKGWGLCLQRLENGIVKGFYPDFLIIRNVVGIGYAIDILEPHRGDLTDNLSKAKALVDYAQKQPSAPIGRLQMIREGKDSITGKKRMKRLDLAKSAVRERVMQLQSTQELDALFLDDSLVE